MIEICRLKTANDIVNEAASRAAKALAAAQTSHQTAIFALAGGRLPPVAFQALSEKHPDTPDWSKIVFVIGDERCVPLDSPDSNWLNLIPTFNSHPEIPKEHLLRPQSNLSAEQAADLYDKALSGFLTGPDTRAIDHLWLGMGEDGHTLSLFPGHPAASGQDTSFVVPIHDSPKPPPDRITLTNKALGHVRSAVVFISGASKASVLERIARGDYSLPIVVASKTIENAGGHVAWLIDDEAMSLVPNGQVLSI